MSTLKVNSITNNGSAVDLPNGAFQIGGNDIVQGYTASASEPSSPTKGDLWWDTDNEKLYQYLNGEFKEIELGASAGGSWTVDLSNVTYDSVSLSVVSQLPIVTGIAFSNDGNKMFLIGRSSDLIHQYSLSTAFDLSTASYDSVSLSVASQDGTPTSLRFNLDGTKMFLIGRSNDLVYQYSLSTAFDLSTASYDSVSFSVAGQQTQPQGLDFSTDGTKMYVSGNNATSVFQYSLSTGFDISTASYDSVSFSVSSQETNGSHGIDFNTDGTKMYIVGTDTDNVHQYTLSTGFDLSTASYDSVSVSVGSQETYPNDLVFSTDGTKMYIVGTGSDSVFQYSTGL